MGELVNIVWPSHTKALCNGLANLFQNQYKTDFVLSSINNESQGIMVHQLILAVFCPSIRNIEDTKLVMQVENLDLNDEDLNLLVEFMYLGKIKVSKDRLPVLNVLAEVLGFKVLANVIKSFNKKDQNKKDENLYEKDTMPVTVESDQVWQSNQSKACESEAIQLSENREELFLCSDELDDKNDSHPNLSEETGDDEGAEVNSDVSDWETDRLKEKRHKFIKSRKSVNRAKTVSRKKLAVSKIIPKDSHNSAKYDVERFYDPARRGLVCKICDKVLKCKSTYVRHVKCHENPSLCSKCNFCDYKSDTKNALVQHLAAKHKVDIEGKKLENTLKCNDCSYTCVSEFQLRNHVYVKHTARKNVCGICGYACRSKAVYDIHLKAVHGNNERPFMCETCGYCAKTLGVLRNHLRTHRDKKTCGICGVWLTFNSYKAHMKLHETSERPFPCHLCTFAARKKFNLKIHLKNVHKIEDVTNLPIEEEEEQIIEDKNTVTAVMINEVGEQLVEMSDQAVMEATFHLEVS